MMLSKVSPARYNDVMMTLMQSQPSVIDEILKTNGVYTAPCAAFGVRVTIARSRASVSLSAGMLGEVLVDFFTCTPAHEQRDRRATKRPANRCTAVTERALPTGRKGWV